MNFIDCRIVQTGDGLAAAADGFHFRIPNGKAALVRSHRDREAVLGIRPEHIGLKSDPSRAGSQTDFEAVVRVVESAGSEKIVHARVGSHSIVVRLDPYIRLKPGEKAEFTVRMETAHIFDKDSGQTLF
jgi:multiple sugar transport system ATP-binding protein